MRTTSLCSDVSFSHIAEEARKLALSLDLQARSSTADHKRTVYEAGLRGIRCRLSLGAGAILFHSFASKPCLTNVMLCRWTPFTNGLRTPLLLAGD